MKHRILILALLALPHLPTFAASGAREVAGQRAMEEPGERMSMGRHRFILGAFQNVRINDDPPALAFIPKPYSIYRFDGDQWDFSILVAGVFNRVQQDLKVGEKGSLFFGAETFFFFVGDRPRIDGASLEQYEFGGHRLNAFVGLKKQWGEGRKHIDLWIRYDADKFFFYDTPTTAGFIAPKNWTEHSISVALEGPPKPPSELFDFGIRPVLFGSARYRQGFERWGLTSFSRNTRKYLAGTTGFTMALSATNDIVVVAKTQTSIVTPSDRINAIRDGSLRIETLGLLLGDIRADRTWTTETGFRWYPFHHRKFGLRPFVHTIYYREILPTEFRTNFAGGGGLKAFGAFNQNTFWNLAYATMSGDRNDMDITHEIRLDITFSWAP